MGVKTKITVFTKERTKTDIITKVGDCILDDICISCVTEEDLETGEYFLDGEFLIDIEGKYKYLEEEAILKVQVDYGAEYFSISNVTKTLDKIDVFARQITIAETLSLWLEDVRPEKDDGQQALTHILDRAIGKKNITVTSDITSRSTAYYLNTNMYEALHNTTNGFVERWGGEVERKGYTLTIDAKRGQDKGVQIRSRKNLTGLEVETNIDSVTTRIKPQGYDGITIDGYVDSEYIDNYKYVRTQLIKYDNVKVRTDQGTEDENSVYFDTLDEAQSELTRLAQLEYSENLIDVLRANYKVNFIDLAQTEEYKEYAQLETVDLGDTIRVIEDKLNIDILVRVINKKYDVLLSRIIELELSNQAKINFITISTLKNELSKVVNDVNENDSWYKQALGEINNTLINGLTDSYVLVRKNEILIMDTNDINTATKLWKWNSAGLAYSSNGYFGEYETAISMDGQIVARFITGLVVNGDQINARNLNVYNDDGIKTLEIDGTGNFTIGSANGETTACHAPGYSKWTHTDGSWTQVDAYGMTWSKGSTNNPYHCLLYAGEYICESEQTIKITLPSEFKGKSFKVVTAVKRIYISQLDYIENARFPLLSFYAEARSVDSSEGTVEIYASVRAWNRTSYGDWGLVIGNNTTSGETAAVKPVVAYWVFA